MIKVNALNLAGEPIFCGVDVHKKSWRVNIRCSEFELEEFSQDPQEERLLNHLAKRYPGARYQVAYEAGFSGFSMQRTLEALGVTCLVVNPADVPTSDKDKKRKSDRIDARKLSRELSAGTLASIYVPSIAMEHARTLVRQRSRLVRDQTRCKTRIWHLLMFSGLRLKQYDDLKYWTRAFVDSLKMARCGTEALRQALDLAIEEYLQVRRLLNQATRQVRALSKQDPYSTLQQLLQSIPGIGVINAMTIMTEIQDINRFTNLDKLCSYAGIVPDRSGSGEQETVKGITHRSNHYLRPAIVESSWVIIRKDPTMLMLYKKYCGRMVPNKAVIKIARHLLGRIKCIWQNQKPYQIIGQG